ncbi:MAG TPA: ribonuclease P protein component [bacterium]|jgi:ribonuclease P protein component
MAASRKKLTLPPRLLKPSEFRRIGRRGKRFRLDFLVMVLSRSGQNGGRLGITISEKAVKHSTRRNRLRRMLKESIRLWWNEVKPGWDILFIINRFPDIDHMWHVESVVLQLFINSGILTGDGLTGAQNRIVEIPAEIKFKTDA